MKVVALKKILVKRMKELVTEIHNAKMIWFVVQIIANLNGMEVWILKMATIVVQNP